MNRRMLFVCTTDSMIWNFLVPHIKELEQKGFYVECASSITGDFYKDLVEIHGIKMNEIPFVRSPYSIKNIRAYKALCKLIKEKNFNTIFCQEPVGGAMGRIAGHKNNCKVIYTAHGFHFYKGAPLINRVLYYSIEKFLSLYTDALITINEEDYQAARNFYAKKVYKINGIGIDTQHVRAASFNRISLRKSLNIPEKSKIILSVGELIPRKNYKTAIDIVAKLKTAQIRYLICGQGILRSEIEEYAKSQGVEGSVIFLGYRRDIPHICACADVFLHPSFQEGLPVAVMEAMACGTPIVASRIRGNVDLIEDGVNGFLCDPKDADGFADRIRTILDEPELAEEFRRNGLEKIKDYDKSIVADQLRKIYCDVGILSDTAIENR